MHSRSTPHGVSSPRARVPRDRAPVAWRLALLCAVLAGAAPGQEPGVSAERTPTPVLTELARFWEMAPEERRRPWAYEFECDVLYYDPGWGSLWVQDATAQAHVATAGQRLPVRHGTRVRIRGTMPGDTVDLSFRGATFETLGPAELEPVDVRNRLTQADQFANRLVRIEGVVDRQSPNDPTHLRLSLATEGRAVPVWILMAPDAAVPEFEGRIVRVRGVYNPKLTPGGELATLEIMVPAPDWVEVLGRLETDPRFERLAVAVNELGRQPVSAWSRVVGVVQAHEPGRVLRLRDESGMVEVFSGQTLAVAPGERVEAIGYPAVRGIESRLEDGVYRRLRDTATAAPESLAPPVAGRPTIRTLQQFWELPAPERAVDQFFDLTCVVLHYDPEWRQLWVGDGTSHAFVIPGDRPLPIRAGHRLAVRGRVPPGSDLTFAEAGITVIGEVETSAVPLGDWSAFNPDMLNRLVAVEGVVDRVHLSDPGHLGLYLAAEGRSLFAWVLLQRGAPVPELDGAIVRIEGIYNPRYTEAGVMASLELMSPGLERVTILGRLESDERFDRPAAPVDRLRDQPTGRLVRVAGEVHSQEPGHHLRVRDASGLVDVLTTQTTVLPVGEPVEAIGRVEPGGAGLRLAGGLYRRRPEAEARPAVRQDLRLAAEVLDLVPEEAAMGRAARLSGVVSWAHPEFPYFYLQDNSGGVRVWRDRATGDLPVPGRNMDVRGLTAMGPFAPEVRAESLRAIGDVIMPAARNVSLEHALTGHEEAQWVRMRGFVRGREERETEPGRIEQVLLLATAAGDFEALLPAGEDVSAHLGASVSLQGVCVAATDERGRISGIRLRLNGLADLQVEEPAPADVFATPRRSLATLGRFASTQAFNRRVRVEGTVLHAAPGRFVIHDRGDSVVALTRDGALPAAGARVDAVGLLGHQGRRVVLREVVWRTIGPGLVPEPTVVSETDRVVPGQDGRLVRIEGVLLDQARAGPVTSLTVQSGGGVFEARLSGAPPALEKGSRLALTGVYDVHFDEYGAARNFALLLRDAGDIRVVARASWFTVSRVLTLSGALALGTAVVFGWVVSLRRRVRRQTEQIRTQLEREGHLQRELERAQRLESLGLLAGGIAHDFNNLLTVVMGNLSLARFDRGIEAETRQSLGDAERAVARARDLTQQLLTFSKGGAPIRVAVDLEGVVREVATFALHGSAVRADFRVAADLWPADVDKGQVGQVVQNIVLNAAQAMPDGGAIEIALDNASIAARERAALSAGRYVRLVIRDQGRGIAPADLPRIFDPYFSTRRQGNGLGLATVYSIVRRHSGDIAVHSEVGRGTTFTVWLPAAAGAAPEVSGVEAARVPPRAGPARILVMDDEPAILRLCENILRRAGHDVLAVDDGAAAVHAWREARGAGRGFDVVIFDLTVPGGMGGRQALQELRASDPDIRAIVSSGYSNDPTLADHRALGFEAMVAKPYEVATLLDTVHSVLQRAPAEGGTPASA